jgi:hypothetical protein
VPGSRFKRRYQLAEVDAEGNAFKIPPPTWVAEPAWLMEPGRSDHARLTTAHSAKLPSSMWVSLTRATRCPAAFSQKGQWQTKAEAKAKDRWE